MERSSFYEKYPSQLPNELHDRLASQEFEVYENHEFGDCGIIFVVFEEETIILTYDDGPLIIQETARTLEEAIKIPSNYF